MDLRLSGKVAVVTGASKGIGLAVTQALAAEGVNVVAVARGITGPLTDLAPRVHPVSADLTTADGPASVVEEAVSRFGGLDILVNNVGAVHPRLAGFASVTDDDWIQALTVTNFCKALSKEVGPRGVRVNTVSPGPVSTSLWLGDDGVAATVAKASGGSPEDIARSAAAQSATGRFSLPQEVADLVLLLAGDRAGNVTGSDFVIDGGLVQTL
ncbi:SDR family oxidoreductase [Kitasatospora sp. NPDC059408]|uniref:SDR family oxidoreductase n=1 Tax=Kitasatospora sp. NPDC059408 TaxID=3346823 RepID=UPI0036C94EC2